MGEKHRQEKGLSPVKQAVLKLRTMSAKLDSLEYRQHEPIAIVGVGLRFPGGVEDADALWHLMLDGKNCVGEVPRDRWDVDAFYDPDPDTPGKMYTRYGAFIDQVDGFDPLFFGISPREASKMDPQQRLLMEVGWETLENAGQAPDKFRGSATGVFLGICNSDYMRMALASAEQIDAFSAMGSTASITASRLSYLLNLKGPSLAVDTACSSSLVAVHLAVRSLRAGECALALAGGVNLMLTPELSIFLSKARALSSGDKCKTFDAAADGYVRGEGCAMVALKRLSDAESQGDRILAVIRGSAINQDGHTSGITAPNGPAQEAVITAALKDGGIQPSEVGYIEAHGTATPLGDPIEMNALGHIFGKAKRNGNPLVIGSVKTNFGHMEAAAGIAGLIKAALAVRNGMIPPHLHLERINPHIPLDQWPFEIPAEAVRFPVEAGPAIAGVSSFGFSGTNAHILLAAHEADVRISRDTHDSVKLLTLSAKSEFALKQAAARLDAHLAGDSTDAFEDICATANTGRSHFNHRLAILAESRQQAVSKLDAFHAGRVDRAMVSGVLEDGEPPAKVAFLFTGQGSQYEGMGHELFKTQPVFRKALIHCEEILRPHLEHPLLEVLYPKSGAPAVLDQPLYTQTALFALEYALVRLWRSWGVRPALVMGHSLGEYAAACAAGVFGIEEGLKLIVERARLVESLPEKGRMAAIFADPDRISTVVSAFKGEASIAALNGPGNTIISGTEAAVIKITEKLTANGIVCRPLNIAQAFHSPLMDPILHKFEHTVRQMRLQPPEITLISNVSGQRVEDAEITDPLYWRRHMREPVRFAAAVNILADTGCRLLIEIGPQPVLLGMARSILPDDKAIRLPSLSRNADDRFQVLESLAGLYVHGAAVDWSGFHRERPYRKCALPTYPFRRKRYWISPNKEQTVNHIIDNRLHPLLHRRIQSPKLDDGTLVFETVLDIESILYLKDHRIFGRMVVPATAYLEMAQAAAGLVFDHSPCRIEGFNILQPLLMEEGGNPTVQVIVSPESETADFEIYCLAEPAEWRLHATGIIRADQKQSNIHPVDHLDAELSEDFDQVRFYDQFAALGIEYGPAFRGLKGIARVEQGMIGRIRIPEEIAHEIADYNLHPALLDICTQILDAVLRDRNKRSGDDRSDGPERIFLPMGLDQYKVHLPGQPAAGCMGEIRESTDEQVFVGNLRIFNPDGAVLAEITGMRFKQAPKDALRIQTRKSVENWFYRLKWQALQPLLDDERTVRRDGQFVVFCEQNGFGPALADYLEGVGITLHCVYPAKGYDESCDHHTLIRPSSLEDMRRMFQRIGATGSGTVRGIVYFWSAAVPRPEGDMNSDKTDLGWPGILNLVKALPKAMAGGESPLSIVTAGGASVGSADHAINPCQAMLWGLGRVIASERPDLRCKLIDIAPGAMDDNQRSMLFDEITSMDQSENQVALRHGERFGLRLVKMDPGQSAGPGTRPYQLSIAQRGVIENFELQSLTASPPGPGQIQIEIETTGLNFRDVLNVLDMYPGDPGPLGNECVGRVAAVGEGVERFAVGDPVLAITPQAYCSHVNTPADLAALKPETISTEEAATVPITFLTAQYALTQIGNIKAGDTVLIHAAAGGVGMAALQVARRAGATIFATAGSRKKRRILRSLGVKLVMDSRSLDFAEKIMAATKGAGIDIVLNSLTGEFISKSISVLKKGGRFIEIGKIDLWEKDRVAQLNPDITYVPFLLGDVCQRNPGRIRVMFDALLQDFRAGKLKPLPFKSFPIGEADAAFRFMAQAKHVGKIVIDQRKSAIIRPNASYIITGGVGGLGLQIARWLADNGARHLILFSRRKAGAKEREAIDKLQETGAKVVFARGDVGKMDDIQRLLSLTDDGHPVKGIIHAAGMVDDAALSNQDRERFNRVLAPKVYGSWNLHRLTESLDLDFFVMCSSASALMGASGQANYATANAFMDGLAVYRRKMGLPALSINWGLWSEIGMAGNLGGKEKNRWSAMGIGQITPNEGVCALGVALGMNGGGQLSVMPVDWSAYGAAIQSRPHTNFLKEVLRETPAPVAGTDSQPNRFLKELEQADPPDRYDLLMAYVQEQLFGVLGLKPSVEIGRNEGFSDLGMDSLMAVELSNRLHHGLKLNLPSTLAFEYPSLTSLVDYLALEVLKRPEENRDRIEFAEPPVDQTSMPPEVDQIDDELVEDLLDIELKKAGF